MEQNVKCKKCKRIIPKGQNVKIGLCPSCFNEVGTVGALLGAGGLAFVGKKLVKNSGKIVELAVKFVKR